jgi:hypothetical protein
MIKDVPLTGVFVNDQDAALDFYTNKLGLEKFQDEPYGEGTRWITVSPAGSRIMIALEKAERDYEKAQVGRSEGRPVLVLSTDDIHASYERLREGRALPRRTCPLSVGRHRSAVLGSGRQPYLPAAGIGRTVAASPSRDALSPVILLLKATVVERSMNVAGIRHRQLLGGRS